MTQEHASHPSLTPDHTLQVGVGFWASKTLLSAIELGVFTELTKRPGTDEELDPKLGLHPRARREFLDALVAVGFLTRQGRIYANTAETDLFLDRAKSSYVGGVLEMMNARLFAFWGSLTEALRTGEPQNEAKRGEDLFATLYRDPQRFKSFLEAMTGVSWGQRRPWRRSFRGQIIGPLSAPAEPKVVRPCRSRLPPARDRHKFRPATGGPSLRELRAVVRPATAAAVLGGGFFQGPAAGSGRNRDGSYPARLASGAKTAAAEYADRNDRGFDFTGADCCGWMRDAGFRETRVEHLVGPDSMVIGIK